MTVTGDIYIVNNNNNPLIYPLLYNAFQVSFPGVKWLALRTDHTPDSGSKVKEGVEPYL